MGCIKVGHRHQWPTAGTLVIQRCEIRCNFCDGDAAKKNWKYAWFLRRHVRAVHCGEKKNQFPGLFVEEIWDDAKTRAPTIKQLKARRAIKREAEDAAADETSDSDAMALPPFITQPEYEEQRYNLAIQAGVAPPRRWNPDLSIEGRTIDPADLHKSLAYEPSFAPDMGFDFDQDGTFTTGQSSVNTDVFSHHLDAFFDELGAHEADRKAEQPTGFVTELDEGDETGMMRANGADGSLAELDSTMPDGSGGTDHNAFMNDLLHDFPDEISINDDQPLAQAYDDWRYKPQSADMYRMIGMLNTAADEMRVQGMDSEVLMPSVEMFARSMAGTVHRDTGAQDETELQG